MYTTVTALDGDGRVLVGADAEVDAVIRDSRVTTLFQPVVELDTGDVTGYEALSRGPEGPLHRPDDLFAAARRADRLPELDWSCRTAAVTSARAAHVRFPLSLLVNAEPETLLADRDDVARWGQFADLRCYCEVTERALTRNPGRLVAALDQIRAQDWGVALDDVGADPSSLALLPLLQPDVIKLDASLLRPPTTPDGIDVGRVVHAVLDQAARSGAAVIAEGIETEADLDLARAYGVTYGQGFLWGRPAPLPTPLPAPRSPMPLLSRILDRAVDPGPFAVLAGARPLRALSSAALSETIRQLLVQAATVEPPPAVLVCSPVPLADLSPPLLGLLEQLGRGRSRPPVFGLLGHPQAELPVTALKAGDPAGFDLAVAVVTPHFAAAVAARTSSAQPGHFDGCLSLDHATATAVACTLLTRLR